jgi:hypothetical protein
VIAELQARLYTMGIEPLGALERKPLLVESRICSTRSFADETGSEESVGDSGV